MARFVILGNEACARPFAQRNEQTGVQVGVGVGVVAVADGTHVVAVDGSHELEAGEPAVHVCKERFLGGRCGTVDEGRRSSVNAAQSLAHGLLDVVGCRRTCGRSRSLCQTGSAG